MKLKITIICFVMLNLFQHPTAKAQFVTIPDAGFVTFLQSAFPGCMSGNQMDTTCAAITTATALNFDADTSNVIIHNLNGVQYFHNLAALWCFGIGLQSLPRLPNTLTTLGCWANSLTSLPALPNSITLLECQYNQLTSLPPLPHSLNFFNCFNNNLTSLPALPNTLTYMDCHNNQLTSLPTLPDSLQLDISCGNNQLTSLPALPNTLFSIACSNNLITNLPALPNSLTQLLCANNQLTSIPPLPVSLNYLWCSANQLTSIPTLPNTLTTLGCSNNLITNLPTLPNNLAALSCDGNIIASLPTLPSSLTQLTCSDNTLTSLPILPSSLTVLTCNDNNLTSLPSLPSFLTYLSCIHNQLTNLPNLPDSLTSLACDSNNISCFPIFPNTLIYQLSISSNPFYCLPNYLPIMNSTTLAIPLCVTGDLVHNPNGCVNAQGIVGYSYKDINGDCIRDLGDSTLINIPVQLYDNTNTLISQSYTLPNGIYDFADTIGTYTVKIDTTGVPYTLQCIHPGLDSINILTTAIPLDTNVNFSLTCKPGFDVGVKSVWVRGHIFPGQQHSLHIDAGDLSHWYNLHCASGVSGQVVVTVTGPVTYNNIISGALTPSTAGNTYTYTIADFGTIDISNSFGLVFTTNTTATIGDTICVNVAVTPTSGDNNISNNTYNYCYAVYNSFDPNYKETYPEYIQPLYDDYFVYTVHFQNTGSAAANNIYVLDTLDSDLDVRTFQLINYSNPNTTWLTGNKLSVNFPNINLPDSTGNYNGSQGFFQYRIKPLAGLPGGTMIHNKASIYFDYNAPVVTNTTLNEFMLATGLNENKNSSLSVYPNPSNGKCFVKLSEGTDVSKLSIEVTNVLGETVLNTKTRNILTQIELINQPSGIYFIRIIGGSQSLNQKIIKE